MKHAPADLDALVRRKSAFESFQALLDAKGGYRPTIMIRDTSDLWLARAYNDAQAKRGDARRAFTGNSGIQACDPIRFFAFGADRYGRVEKVGRTRVLVSYVTKVNARAVKQENVHRLAAGLTPLTAPRYQRYFPLDSVGAVENRGPGRFWRI
jgi:hypothetical protein